MGIKIFGAMLILVSGTLVGWIIAQQYVNRVKQLKEVQLAVKLFNTEISYTQTILAEALKKAGEGVTGPISLIFKDASHRLTKEKGSTFTEIWQMVLNNNYQKNSLIKEDLKILGDWGKQIGSSDLTEQIKINELTLERLLQAEKRAEEIADKKVKLSRYAGLMISLIVIILFY